MSSNGPFNPFALAGVPAASSPLWPEPVVDLIMCGIAGALFRAHQDAAGAVSPMIALLDHRGPDGAGLWHDVEAGIVLGHRRLAIVDLSPAGAQPMLSTSGRYVLVYNGEIYNHGALRAELVASGCTFRGRSDTEVLLAAIEQWGLEVAIRRSVGMFAAGCWDRRERRLWLFRDRMGEKPLYVARAPGALLFASELAALTAWPGFERTLDPAAVATYFQRGYVPAPRSIWREARKLAPGTLLDLSVEDLDRPGIPIDRARRFWSLAEVAAEARDKPLRMSDAEAVATCERALLEAIVGQSIADVPLGIFLSGGIDSSLVLALLQRATGRPARSFTIGFAREGFDEREAARRIARHLGAEHSELEVTAEDALAVVPRLSEIYDEPLADPSQIPTVLVAEFARRRVTVALSGDSADELFGGYDRYVAARRLGPLLRAPRSLRCLLGAGIDALGGGCLAHLLAFLPASVRERAVAATSGDRLRKLAAVLKARDRAGLARRCNSIWDDPAELLVERPGQGEADRAGHGLFDSADLELAMMLEDALGWLPDDILVKTDRATMAVSLEARAPFLDHRVVELALRLPLEQKIRAGRGKWVLRRLLARYLPEELIRRPKMGFRPPLGAWLRGPLRDWAEILLESRSLARSGLLDPGAVRRCWRQHVEGSRERADQLWAILVFQSWLERWTAGSDRQSSRVPMSEAEPFSRSALSGASV